MYWLLVMSVVSIMLTIMSVWTRLFGFTLKSYLIVAGMEIAFIAWMLPLGYKLAPSFFQAYMFTIGALSLGGWAASAFYFHEAVTYAHYLGVFLIIAGSVLLA